MRPWRPVTEALCLGLGRFRVGLALAARSSEARAFSWALVSLASASATWELRPLSLAWASSRRLRVHGGLGRGLGTLGLGLGALDALLGGPLGVLGVGLGLGSAIRRGLEGALGILDLGGQAAELGLVAGPADGGHGRGRAIGAHCPLVLARAAVVELLQVVVTLLDERTHLRHDLVEEVVDVPLLVSTTELRGLEVLVEHLFRRKRHVSPRYRRNGSGPPYPTFRSRTKAAASPCAVAYRATRSGRRLSDPLVRVRTCSAR